MIFKLGLTGSIGMGKTTTAHMFRALGVPVWEADQAVHRLYSSSGLVPNIFTKEIPGSVAENGEVDRAKLKKLISQDAGVLQKINAIVHPLVAADRTKFTEDKTGLVVYDIPLLFETEMDKSCDAIAVVSTDPETQRMRVMARKTMTEDEFSLILSQQLPDREKRARADYIIETTSMEDAKKQVVDIYNDIMRKLGCA